MMSTPRLKNIQRLENNNRKCVCIMNDVAKMQQLKYEGSIDREKQESSQTSEKSISKARKDLVRRHVLKKCMHAKREEIEKQQGDRMFGRYHGETAEHISEDINSYIETNHPRLRRKKKIEALYKTACEKGVILNDETMKDKVQNFFTKPIIKVQHFDSDGSRSPVSVPSSSTFPPMSKTFYTGHAARHFNEAHDFHHDRYEHLDEIPETDAFTTDESDNDDTPTPERIFVKRQAQYVFTEEARRIKSVQSDAPKTLTIPISQREPRPLTLPTVKPERDSEDVVPPAPKSADKQYKGDCISELLDRLHKAKDCREKDAKVKKERRAKRLQAERLRAMGFRNSIMDPSKQDWTSYEAKRKELISSITQTKQIIGLESDDESPRKGFTRQRSQLRLPPIAVTQKVMLSKTS